MGKQYLEAIKNKIRKKHRRIYGITPNQFQNGLKAIKNKRKSSFRKIDIVDFYPSKSKQLLSKTIDYTQYVTNIEENMIKTICHA